MDTAETAPCGDTATSPPPEYAKTEENEKLDALTSAVAAANLVAPEGMTFAVVTMHGTGGTPYRIDAVRDGSIEVLIDGMTKSQAAKFLLGIACGLGLGPRLDS